VVLVFEHELTELLYHLGIEELFDELPSYSLVQI
jgi:hypothetical protein